MMLTRLIHLLPLTHAGGLDGILTSFAIISSATGSNVSPDLVLALGLANLIANALGMAVGEFLSARAEDEWISMERAREEWEWKNGPDGEREEMVEIFHKQHSLSLEHAEQFIDIMAQYPEFMVDMMMVHELGVAPDKALTVGKEGTRSTGIMSFFCNINDLVEPAAMFLAFFLFGAIPLVGYAVIPALAPEAVSTPLDRFVVAAAVNALALFALGSLKGLVGTRNWWSSGLETLMLGMTCAFVAFAVGRGVISIVHDFPSP